MKLFYALDLDKTLIDTDKLYDVLDIALERHTAINLDDLRKERTAIEMYGESFDTIGRIQQLLTETRSSVSWQEIQQSFVAEAQKNEVLEPYAAELLKILDDRNLAYGIITFGHETWQHTKMKAAGLVNVPRIVTEIKEKGQILTSWKQTDGSFIIPPAMSHDRIPLHVNSVVFLDDKAISFKDIPEGVRGVCIRSPTRELLPSQQGALPPLVESVSGLANAIELLFKQ